MQTRPGSPRILPGARPNVVSHVFSPAPLSGPVVLKTVETGDFLGIAVHSAPVPVPGSGQWSGIVYSLDLLIFL